MGVPQGSVMDPLLWNVMYNGVLVFPVSEGATIVGFADDLIIVVTAVHPDDMGMHASETVRRVKSPADLVGRENSSGLHKEP